MQIMKNDKIEFKSLTINNDEVMNTYESFQYIK